MKMKQVEQYLDSCSDEQLRAFIAHCEHRLDSADGDDDLREAARGALKLARGERAVRELLRGLHGEAEQGE